jgi:hypothetical protein
MSWRKVISGTVNRTKSTKVKTKEIDDVEYLKRYNGKSWTLPKPTTVPLNKSKYEECWMPFTDNRNFKKSPRIVKKAKGIYYYDER